MSDDVQYTLPQAVTFDNLADVRKVAEARIETADPEHTLTIGIGDLGHGGSAAVALMIALFRRAHVKGRNIQHHQCFRHDRRAATGSAGNGHRVGSEAGNGLSRRYQRLLLTQPALSARRGRFNKCR